ncbi:MAG: hypothetical protein QM756_31955 [Polyangiaceae bacterium]
MKRRSLLGGAAVLGLGAGCYLLWPSEQRRVLGVLHELLASLSALPNDTDRARASRVRAALAKLTLPSLSVTIAELGLVEGQPALLELLTQLDGLRLTVDVQQAVVRLTSSGAQATLSAAFTATLIGEQRRQVRTLSFDLVRRAEQFLVAQATVSAVSHEQPEARP